MKISESIPLSTSTASDPQASLTLELRPAEDVDDVLAEWGRLESQLDEVPLAASRIWTELWLKHYGDWIPHRFYLGRRDGQLCGAALVTEGVNRTDGPFRVRSVHLGTAGEPETDSVCVEYNTVLAQPADRDEFARMLLAELLSQPNWDELCLDGFAASDCEPFLVGAQFIVAEKPSHFFDFDAARDASKSVYESLGYATRKHIRRNFKMYGKLTGQWAETADEADSIFADLVRLHQAKWNAVGQPGAFAGERFRRFHLDLVHHLLPKHQVSLFRVTDGGDVIGCVQNYIEGDRVLSYQSGFASYSGKQSPGLMTDYLCMEECLARGFSAYDFLGGDSHHKRVLSTDSGRLLWARIRRPRWKFLITDVGRRIKRVLRGQTHDA